MGTFDLDKFRDIWDEANKGFENHKPLSPEILKEFKRGKSLEFSDAFCKMITFDIIVKTVLLLASIGLVCLYYDNRNVSVTILLLSLFNLYLIYSQIKYRKRLLKIENLDKPLNEVLKEKLNFIISVYRPLLYNTSFTNPIFFIVGSLYYFQYAYGTVRPLDLTDGIVFICFIIASFILTYYITKPQVKDRMQLISSCIEDVGIEDIKNIEIKAVRRKRKIQWFTFTLFLLGLILLVAALLNFGSQILNFLQI